MQSRQLNLKMDSQCCRYKPNKWEQTGEQERNNWESADFSGQRQQFHLRKQFRVNFKDLIIRAIDLIVLWIISCIIDSQLYQLCTAITFFTFQVLWKIIHYTPQPKMDYNVPKNLGVSSKQQILKQSITFEKDRTEAQTKRMCRQGKKDYSNDGEDRYQFAGVRERKP